MANNLLRLRTEVNMPLREVSKKTGISTAVLSYLETGKRPLTQKHIGALTAFYSVTADYLLGRTDYGYIVIPEYGDGELILAESEYLRMRDSIKVSVVRLGGKSTALNLSSKDKQTKEEIVVVPEYTVYRELQGTLSDGAAREALATKLQEICKRLTSEQLQRAIRFIEDYILSR